MTIFRIFIIIVFFNKTKEELFMVNDPITKIMRDASEIVRTMKSAFRFLFGKDFFPPTRITGHFATGMKTSNGCISAPDR